MLPPTRREPAPAPSRMGRLLAPVALVGAGAALASAVWFFVPARGFGDGLFTSTTQATTNETPIPTASAAVLAAHPSPVVTAPGLAPSPATAPPSLPDTTVTASATSAQVAASPTSTTSPPVAAAPTSTTAPVARPGSMDLAAAPLSSEALLAATLGAVPLPTAPSPSSTADARTPAAVSVTEGRPARARDVGARRIEAARESSSRRTESTRDARTRDGKSATTAAPAEAAAVVTGVVRLAVSPWGRIEVDGAPAGVAPPLTQLSLPPGRHRITVSNEDFPPFSAWVDVTADQPVSLKHRFGS